MNNIVENYQRYKWFFTSSNKLIVGGKSAEQNDELLGKIKQSGKELIVMHTSHPGSPFCVILASLNEVKPSDLEEAAIFTGSFSRAWKEGKRKTEVHIFKSSQIDKGRGMKTGTWGVKGKVEHKEVELKLALVKQKEVYRAVPDINLKNKDILLKIAPGKIDKTGMIDSFAIALKKKEINREELLSALPAGGVKILR